jgi:Mrp family chromosome partitioning ATPase
MPVLQSKVKSGVEQLKQDIEILRSANTENALPAMPAIETVETINAFASLPTSDQLSLGNYYCVIEDFNPQSYAIQTPAMSVEFIQTPAELSIQSPEKEAAKTAEQMSVSEKLVSESTSSASAPVKNVTPPAPSMPTSVEAEVLWEVDQFLYPALTDQLLQSYAYFSQAGDKLAKATASGLKVLGITGVGPGEGRTTLAICLARAAARAGLRVGLLDADFNSPSLATQLGLEIEHGWEQALIKSITLPETAVRALDDRITLYPWVMQGKQVNPTIIDAKVARFIEQAAAANQLLILDLGPWREVSLKANQRLPFDAAIVVQDLRTRQVEDVNPIAQWLHDAGVEAVGIAENFTPAA